MFDSTTRRIDFAADFILVIAVPFPVSLLCVWEEINVLSGKESSAYGRAEQEKRRRPRDK